MGEEFHAVLKLITGEEIFSLVSVDENDGDSIIMLSNPVIMKMLSSPAGKYVKVKPWLELPDQDLFLIKYDKIITMSEVNDEQMIKFYNRYLNEDDIDIEIDGQVTLNATEYESLRRNRSLNGTNIQRAKNAQNNSIEAMLNGGAPAPGKLSTQSNSLEGTIRQLYNLSVGNSGTAFAMGKGEQYGRNGTATRLDMFCNQVQIPEKQIQFGLYRHYGSPTPHPTAIQYGQLTTQFYSDGIMSIKKFFDAWQKLVYNDVTGNTNYYKEYIGSMQILTQKNVLVNEVSAGISGNNIENENGFLSGLRKGAKAVQGAVQDFTKSYNNFFAGNEPGDAGHFMEENKYTGFKTEVRDTYGVKVFECWPSIVGQVQFGHDMIDQIGRLDVTWAYKSWDAFGFSVSGRGDDVPLSIGEVRNEKDGFPFLEDLPPELGGPLTEGLTGAINAIPIGRATGGKMFF